MILVEEKTGERGKLLSAEFDHLFSSRDMIKTFKTGRMRRDIRQGFVFFLKCAGTQSLTSSKF